MTTASNMPDPTSSLEIVTPEIAQKWLDEFNSGNRKKRAKAISRYAEDMSASDWLVTGDAIRFDWNGRMVDGQHRCHSVVRSGASIKVFVVRGLDPRVREVIDQNVPRSAADALGFNNVDKYRSQLAAVLKVIHGCERGIITRANSSNNARPTNSQIVDLFHDNPGIEDSVAAAMAIHKRVGGTPTPIAVAHYVLSQIDPDDNDEFWDAAATRRTNGIGDPRNTMCDALANRNKVLPNHSTEVAYQLFVIFKCWNAWRDGKELKVIKSSYTRDIDGVATVTYAEIPAPR